LDASSVPLLLHGAPGEIQLIEVSADLQLWSALASVTNGFGTVQYNDTRTPGPRFYRARSRP
jgi:hypothetical protein